MPGWAPRMGSGEGNADQTVSSLQKVFHAVQEVVLRSNPGSVGCPDLGKVVSC